MTGTIERIIRSLDVALDRRKLVFALLSLLLLGLVFGAVVVVSGLFGQLAGWLGGIVLFLGMLLLMALNGVTTGGLSYMMVAQLAGNRNVPLVEAITYAGRRSLVFGLAPFVFIVLGLGMALAEMLLLLPGRLPAVGPLWSALLFYPLLLVNVFVAIGVLVGSMLLYPSLVAGDKSLPAAVKEVVLLVRQSPMQILVTLSLGLFVLGLTFYIALVLLLVAGSWTSSVTAAGAGRLPAGDLGNLMAESFFNTMAGFNPMVSDPFMRDVVPSDPAGNLGGILFALLTAVFVFTLLSIPVSLVNGLGAAVYLSVNPTAVPPAQPAPQPVAPPPPQPINVPQP